LTAVDDEIQTLRANANSEIEQERRRLSEQRQALLREQETLAKTVSQAAARFGEGRSELLSDLLSLLPALEAAGVLQTSAIAQAAPPTEEKQAATTSLPAAFTISQRQSLRLGEQEFFERLTRHVQTSGFRYRDADLKAFHISVKCGDLTILTGLSGVGKSSLIRLYAEALAGEDQAARGRLLTIDVSPSWTEPQDILGNVNLLDRSLATALPEGALARGLLRMSVRLYPRIDRPTIGCNKSPASEAPDPGRHMSEHRATSSRNARATSSESAVCLIPAGFARHSGDAFLPGGFFFMLMTRSL
jgi:hypothetical protein